MSGLFGDTPDPPQAPPPPPPAPTIDDARQNRQEADRLRRRRGHAALFLSQQQAPTLSSKQPGPNIGGAKVLGGGR